MLQKVSTCTGYPGKYIQAEVSHIVSSFNGPLTQSGNRAEAPAAKSATGRYRREEIISIGTSQSHSLQAQGLAASHLYVPPIAVAQSPHRNPWKINAGIAAPEYAMTTRSWRKRGQTRLGTGRKASQYASVQIDSCSSISRRLGTPGAASGGPSGCGGREGLRLAGVVMSVIRRAFRLN